MAMENYSPSHPTDEVDLDNSPDDIKILSESIGKSKFSESIEQPQVFDIIDRSKFSENVGKSIEYELSKHPIKERSRSMSPDVRKVKSKSRSHSRSRKRRSKSRSRNRRSRSRNRTDRSRNRDREYNRRSTDRKSHSKDRRSRSKDRKPRSNERRSKSRDRRSRSRNSRYNSRSRDSPNQYRSKEKKNDNIFSKMNELSNKSSEPISKQKWNYDSDEDTSPKKAETMNVLEPVDRFDDMKPLVNFNESSSRVDDMKPLPRRNEFFNRRGGNDQFRGFQRNRNWEPRNSGRSNFPPRNDQRFNRNKFGFNDDDTTKWQGNKNEDSSLQKMSWNDGKQDDDLGEWGKPVENNDSPIPDKKGFAADSDEEECNNWGNDNKNAINEMLTAANIESQRKVIPIKNNVETLPESKNNFAADSDEEFGTWGNEQKVQTEQPQFRKESFNNRNESFNSRNESFNDRNESFNNRNENKSGNDSDEEFGSWGKDRNKPRNFNQSNDNQGDSFNPASQQFFSHNQRQQFNRNDSNPRFQGRRAANNNFNRFQRPNNQERFNNNNFNSSSGNFSNSNYSGNSNFSNFNPAPPNISQQSQQQQPQEIMSQLPMQIPPYNFNPSQRPPQWPPMNNLNFPPMCNNQMPFNPLPMIPQMQYSQINQSQQQTSQQQQSSLSIPNMMQGMSYIPPPPPSSQPTGVNNSQINSNSFNQSILPQANDNNLLETIMTNVGLSSKSIRLQPDIFKPQPPQSNKNSVNDSLHNIIKSAASTVLSRLVESTQKSNSNTGAGNTAGNISDSMSMSPPSPSSSPPPPFTKSTFNLMSTLDNSEFILPPLPNYSDVLKPATCSSSSMANVSMPLPMSLSNTATSNQSFKQLSASSEISEEKRNRSDFESKSDWQERIALEVKNFLRPAYMSKKITKSDYKEIMKRCVTKISRSGVTEINTEKIEKFVLSYVDKYQKFRRGKQHGVVSSSEHELVM